MASSLRRNPFIGKPMSSFYKSVKLLLSKHRNNYYQLKINNMTFQINTDKNIEGSERFTEYFTILIEDESGRYDKITRIELHLSDEK